MSRTRLKIALIGYGKMGRMLDGLAAEEHCDVVARIDPPNGGASIDSLTKTAVDVCIDFSHPDSVIPNLVAVAEKKINLLVGTTGWENQRQQVLDIVSSSGIGFLFSPNFSLGVNLYLKILKEMALLMNPHTAYDAAVTEAHHRQKVDIPSGTARTIAQTLLDGLDRKKKLLVSNHNGPVKPDELHVSSLRCGDIPGTHTVAFDSIDDTLSLTHTARSREGFARGALAAAHWLRGKQGTFTMDDLL